MERIAETKILSGIAFIYLVVTSFFSLLRRLAGFLTQDVWQAALLFARIHLLWLVVIIAILIVLWRFIRKHGWQFSADFIQDRTIRVIAGMLITLEGIINFSSTLPLVINSTAGLAQALQGADESFILLATKTVLSNAISLLFILGQIVMGAYLFLFYKKDQNAG